MSYREVTFDFLADCITKKVKPKDTDIEVYYGLEHLDADSLRIKRSGTPDDVVGEKIHALPGDIIFGKRRAYQRKLGVTDCECIASAHSMVLRAKPENVVAEFLPYFMQSDEFMERAVMISEGSLSPTIKWKTLAKEKFIIPDTESQCKIAEIMKAFDNSVERTAALIESLRNLAVAFLENKFENISDAIALNLIADINRGCSWDKENEYINHVEGSYPVIRIGNIKEALDLNDLLYITIDEDTFNKYKAFKNTVLIVGSNGNKERVGNCCFVDQDIEFVFASFLVGVVSKDPSKYFPKYLYYCINSKRIQDAISAGTSGSTGINNMGLTFLRELEIPICSFDKQINICKHLDEINCLIGETRRKLETEMILKNQMLNKLLKSGGDHQ